MWKWKWVSLLSQSPHLPSSKAATLGCFLCVFWETVYAFTIRWIHRLQRIDREMTDREVDNKNSSFFHTETARTIPALLRYFMETLPISTWELLRAPEPTDHPAVWCSLLFTEATTDGHSSCSQFFLNMHNRALNSNLVHICKRSCRINS